MGTFLMSPQGDIFIESRQAPIPLFTGREGPSILIRSLSPGRGNRVSEEDYHG